MTAITISCKHGSLGGPVAEKVAEQLGWKYVDRTFINKVISEYGLIRLGELYDTPPKLRDLFDQDTQWTIEWMTRAVETLAVRYDVVIVGRGGFAALKDYADVYNVLVTAPDDVRIQRTMEDEGISQDKARKRVERDTLTKTRFVRRYYGENWADESNYDLVVDTSELSVDEAVTRIVEGAKEHFATAQGPKAADAKVAPLLLETIEQQFARRG